MEVFRNRQKELCRWNVNEAEKIGNVLTITENISLIYVGGPCLFTNVLFEILHFRKIHNYQKEFFSAKTRHAFVTLVPVHSYNLRIAYSCACTVCTLYTPTRAISKYVYTNEYGHVHLQYTVHVKKTCPPPPPAKSVSFVKKTCPPPKKNP